MKKQLAAAAAVLAVAGAGAGAVVAQEAPPTVDIDVAKRSIAVEGADALRSGPTRLAFENATKGEKGLLVMQLAEGVTRAEVREAAARLNPNKAGRYGRFVASTFLMPGGEYATTVDLAPAEYVIVDFTKRPAVRGGFTVGTERSSAVAPAPAVTVGLVDYGFEVPDTVPAEGVMRVENRGDVLHHMLAFPLRRGVNERRLLKRIKAGKEPGRTAFAGPPTAPVEIVSPGTVNDVELPRQPGRTLFVCFLQDKRKSPPHAALGMAKVVSVE